MSATLSLFDQPVMRQEEFDVRFKRARGYKGELLARLEHIGARDLSDETIERAMSPVVMPHVCTRMTKMLRDFDGLKVSDIYGHHYEGWS